MEKVYEIGDKMKDGWIYAGVSKKNTARACLVPN
jgi:hypothetical protein